MIFKPIDAIVFRFIRAQIEARDTTTAKRGLQHLCQLYRSGYRITTPAELHAIGLTIIGLVSAKPKDAKVRRWALNALALLKPKNSEPAILHALNICADDPQTVASAIAALAAIKPDTQAFLLKQKML